MYGHVQITYVLKHAVERKTVIIVDCAKIKIKFKPQKVSPTTGKQIEYQLIINYLIKSATVPCIIRSKMSETQKTKFFINFTRINRTYAE